MGRAESSSYGEEHDQIGLILYLLRFRQLFQRRQCHRLCRKRLVQFLGYKVHVFDQPNLRAIDVWQIE